MMRTIRTYATKLDAEVARIPLERAGIPSMVVGIDVGMEGGAAGVQLLVPEERTKAALALLDEADV
jgi:hypothetical protein